MTVLYLEVLRNLGGATLSPNGERPVVTVCADLSCPMWLRLTYCVVLSGCNHSAICSCTFSECRALVLDGATLSQTPGQGA